MSTSLVVGIVYFSVNSGHGHECVGGIRTHSLQYVYCTFTRHLAVPPSACQTSLNVPRTAVQLTAQVTAEHQGARSRSAHTGAAGNVRCC
jgi:hypothetical protein